MKCPACGHGFVSLDELNRERRLVTESGAPRHTGVSSDAMTKWAYDVGARPMAPGTPIFPNAKSWRGEECERGCPADPSDLDACRRTIILAERLGADRSVIERMREVYAETEAWVLDGINRHGVKIAEGYRNKPRRTR